MAATFVDPLQTIIDSAKGKRVSAVQDPNKMKRDHISTVGRMVLFTKTRDPEPFLTTNQMFEREVDVPEGHGDYVPPNPYKSWANFNIITGMERPALSEMDPELAKKIDSVDPLSRSSAWDHPKEFILPRAQQQNQHFLRSHEAFPHNAAHPGAAVEWKSAEIYVDSKHRHERAQLSLAEKYGRPVTASSVIGWGLEADYKHGRVPPKDFHFGCAPRARPGAPRAGCARPLRAHPRRSSLNPTSPRLAPATSRPSHVRAGSAGARSPGSSRA